MATEPKPNGPFTATEVAQGFLISLGSKEELIDIEWDLIQNHGIDENKYRWEVRFLQVAATEYAFFSLMQGKFATRVAAVREAYWNLLNERSEKDEEGAFIVAKCRARLEKYGPAIEKEERGAVGAPVGTEFAHQFGPVSDKTFLLLLNAGTTVFNGAFYGITEVLTTQDIET